MHRLKGHNDIAAIAGQCIDTKCMDELYSACDEYNMGICDNCDVRRDAEEYTACKTCDEQMTLALFVAQTGEVAFRYKTGYSVPECMWDYEAQETELQELKLFFGIDSKEHDKTLLTLLCNHTGGHLHVYFCGGFDTFLPVDGGDFDNVQSIRFSGDVNIGIVDGFNGSGYCVTLQHEFTLPFDMDNLFVDSLWRYSWTKDIAGLDEDWCSSTQYTLLQPGEVV